MEARERIKYLRERKQMNQKELAEKAGINKSVMNRIETGIRPMTEQELSTFADILESSADYILGRKEYVYGQKSDPIYSDLGDKLEDIQELLYTTEPVVLYGEVIGDKEKNILKVSLSHTIEIAKELKNLEN